MNVLVSELEAKFADRKLFSSRSGADSRITRISPAETCQPGDLVFVDRPEFLQIVAERKPAAVVVDHKLAGDCPDDRDLAVLTSTNVRLAHALIKGHYCSRNLDAEGWPRIHPSAVIHDSVEVLDSVHVGPNVTIGKGAQLAEGCRVLAGAVIESNARLGQGCLIHPQAVVGHDCILGDRVEVGAGTVIGSEGFGFGQDERGKAYKIPQSGNVVIDDDVHIGAGNCIDRGAYGATRIGVGTKIDNLCHIAHGVQVGKDCMLTAMLCVAGSTKIGDRVWTSGQTGILDHKSVCNDVVLVHRAGVVKDIKRPGIYAGIPVQPLKQYAKNTAQQRQLTEMSKKIKQLEATIAKLTNNEQD